MSIQLSIDHNLPARIERAETIGELRLMAGELRHIIGIEDTERAALNRKIDERTSAINAAAVGERKGRW